MGHDSLWEDRSLVPDRDLLTPKGGGLRWTPYLARCVVGWPLTVLFRVPGPPVRYQDGLAWGLITE